MVVMVETERGHIHKISVVAVDRLRAARTAKIAELVFNDYADHIPRSERLDVWLACDD